MNVKCYCLNLPERTDRKANFVKSVAEKCSNMSYEFVIPVKHSNRRHSCRLSHHAIIKRYYETESKKFDGLMVCEDDCEFVRHFSMPLNDIPKKSDMIFLSCRPKIVKATKKADWYRLIDGWSMACYVIPNHFIPRYLEVTRVALERSSNNMYGFEHIRNYPDAKKFMSENNIILPRELYATINVDKTIGFSSIEQIPPRRSQKEANDRICWTKNVNVKILE